MAPAMSAANAAAGRMLDMRCAAVDGSVSSAYAIVPLLSTDDKRSPTMPDKTDGGKLKPRDGAGRFITICHECGVYPADPPAKTCPGCDAYREHQDYDG